MTTELVPFIDPGGKEIRGRQGDDGRWYVGKEVCTSLGIKDWNSALARLNPSMKGKDTIHTLGGPFGMIYVLTICPK
jgi:hypothetical protein